VTEARKKAKLYAEGAGAALGQVTTISEGSHSPWRTYEFAMAQDVKMANHPLPIATGEQELSVSVSVTYDLVHPSK